VTRVAVFLAGLAAVLGGLAALLASPPPAVASPCATRTTPPATYQHVVWVVMENHSYTQIIGSPSAPYINSLASQCGVPLRYYALSHPSLPNYLGMTSGQLFGIQDDNPPSSHPGLPAEDPEQRDVRRRRDGGVRDVGRGRGRQLARPDAGNRADGPGGTTAEHDLQPLQPAPHHRGDARPAVPCGRMHCLFDAERLPSLKE
jgi:hypothetical protein